MLAREKIPSSMGRSTAVFSIPMATRDRRRAAASRSFFRTRFLWANAFSLLGERIKIEKRGAVEVNTPNKPMNFMTLSSLGGRFFIHANMLAC